MADDFDRFGPAPLSQQLQVLPNPQNNPLNTLGGGMFDWSNLSEREVMGGVVGAVLGIALARLLMGQSR